MIDEGENDEQVTAGALFPMLPVAHNVGGVELTCLGLVEECEHDVGPDGAGEARVGDDCDDNADSDDDNDDGEVDAHRPLVDEVTAAAVDEDDSPETALRAVSRPLPTTTLLLLQSLLALLLPCWSKEDDDILSIYPSTAVGRSVVGRRTDAPLSHP